MTPKTIPGQRRWRHHGKIRYGRTGYVKKWIGKNNKRN